MPNEFRVVSCAAYLFLAIDPACFAPTDACLEGLHPEGDGDREGDEGERARIGAEDHGWIVHALHNSVMRGENFHERSEGRHEEQYGDKHVADEAAGIVRVLFLSEEHRGRRKELGNASECREDAQGKEVVESVN